MVLRHHKPQGRLWFLFFCGNFFAAVWSTSSPHQCCVAVFGYRFVFHFVVYYLILLVLVDPSTQYNHSCLSSLGAPLQITLVRRSRSLVIFALAFAGSNTAGWYHNPAFVQGLVAWAPRPRFTSIRGHAPASGCCEVRLSRAQPHVQLPSNNKTRSPTRRGRSRRKSLHAWTHASSGGGSVPSNRSTFRERPNLVTTTSHFFA